MISIMAFVSEVLEGEVSSSGPDATNAAAKKKLIKEILKVNFG